MPKFHLLALSIDPILNKKWQLIELNSIAFDAEESPYIQFSSDSKLTGFTGCNDFSVVYDYQQPSQLKFNDYTITMKNCNDSAELDGEFIAIFHQVDNFTLSQDSQELSLNTAQMSPLARFSVVE